MNKLIKKKKPVTIKQLQLQLNELETKWKRALADYQNLEKRVVKDRVSFVQFANAALIDKLLAVLDGLEQAANHLKDQGLNLMVEQFKAVLAIEEVKEIKVLNQMFDPQTMDCVELVAGPANKVISVSQKGYWLKDKVIRPAKVKVGQGR
ncbi:nucleotide exchange factor GrpE [Patescibacteria group bacterium]|nr:nucleotide exchange factor GrpE [Patescibacteria group bacterium]MBU1931080.1 nucleotide exchange factor GrpE [Patescibacteria group bacterium]